MAELPIETAPDGATPTPRRVGHRWFDAIVSISAILISVVSLYLAIDNSRTQRQLLAASSWPFLSVVVSNFADSRGSIEIGTSNDGIGPAKVKSLEIFYAGHPVSDPNDLLRRCCGLSSDPAVRKAQLPEHGYLSSTVDETVLRSGERNIVLRFTRTAKDPAVLDRLARSLANVSFRACYCSVLDQCWFGDLWTTRTRPVSTCPPPEHPFRPIGR